MDNIDYNDPKVLDSIGTGKTDGVFQLESGGHEELHEGAETAESGRYHRRYFPVPSGSDGFYPAVISREKIIRKALPMTAPQLRADPGADLWLYRLSGAGYADRAGPGWLYAGTKLIWSAVP